MSSGHAYAIERIEHMIAAANALGAYTKLGRSAFDTDSTVGTVSYLPGQRAAQLAAVTGARGDLAEAILDRRLAWGHLGLRRRAYHAQR